MKLIAFDSGIERTGFAVFEKEKSSYELIDYGCIFTIAGETLSARIHVLCQEVDKLMTKHKPDHFVLEKLFFNTNQKTAIMVAQAQGAVLAIAGKHSVSVDFITPIQIKQTITGYGRTDKKGVQKMVKLLLNLPEIAGPDDVADAIACGLTYCTTQRFSL